jgi:hypothetical protein
MDADDAPDIPDILFHFLSRLPQTIRADVLSFVVLYAMDDPGDVDAHSLDRLGGCLAEPPGPKLFSAVLRIVATVDHVLTRIPGGAQDEVMLRQYADRATPQLAALIEKIVLGLPIRRRHCKTALSDWVRLRATAITAQTLRDFEDRCLAPPRRPVALGA